MELVSIVKEVLQNAAERAASYRMGQTTLRYMDRALWIIEKSARWAVPPPLDQDERPQPELIRPLPWVLFFPLLIILRITREFISLANLVLGKPPLRSADVVCIMSIYLQN
ncbi:jg520 [Pararge aegeria aegeria]|uniref:Jg520 protein n=1 Tax=Pararge aegeria aegeria TaxID=348720 RepID=A0A8S4S5P6_9NEOP|nr:jg520 [Pararge aegeria aegeria]